MLTVTYTGYGRPQCHSHRLTEPQSSDSSPIGASPFASFWAVSRGRGKNAASSGTRNTRLVRTLDIRFSIRLVRKLKTNLSILPKTAIFDRLGKVFRSFRTSLLSIAQIRFILKRCLFLLFRYLSLMILNVLILALIFSMTIRSFASARLKDFCSFDNGWFLLLLYGMRLFLCKDSKP